MKNLERLKILPSLLLAEASAVNLNEIAKNLDFAGENSNSALLNPLLNPTICQQMVDAYHQGHGVRWSYGGYLEDRSTLWRGSYLEQSGNFIHLGIDYNVPAGTPVAAPCDCQVLLIDDDQELDGGWGPRVIVEQNSQSTPHLIFAHLSNISCAIGDQLKSGQIFAKVGAPPHNGNWFPHLHLQSIDRQHFEELKVDGLARLDGYGHPSRIEQLRRLFPDPTRFH